MPRSRSSIVVIDNYDSFTYNLVHALRSIQVHLDVFRNDEATTASLTALHPDGIVLSPGPGRPEDAGITTEVVRKLAGHCPILGICLGHQAIAQVFGARIVRARVPVHGKISKIRHDGKTIFSDVHQSFAAARYHSLVVSRRRFPRSLVISAWSADGTIMALRHRTLPLEGVQFHPESFLTPQGEHLLRNFVRRILEPAVRSGIRGDTLNSRGRE